MTSLRRWLGAWLPGARDRRSQIVAHAEAWRLANDAAGSGGGPLWVVLGDSTAQAIGATAVDRGYVGVVRSWLGERDGRPWRVVNLSQSGARTADVLADQLPALSALAPDLVSCAIGVNDLLRRSRTVGDDLAAIASGLPRGSLLANLPRGLREAEARGHNDLIAGLAERHHLRLVDLWSATGPPWRGKYAADLFHPNDLGYQDWSAAFVEALTRP